MEFYANGIAFCKHLLQPTLRPASLIDGLALDAPYLVASRRAHASQRPGVVWEDLWWRKEPDTIKLKAMNCDETERVWTNRASAQERASS